MEIKIENAKAALKTADESVKKVLLALLPELKETEAQTAANRPITERVKTFEDACRELGEDHPFVLAYQNTNLRDPEVAEENRDILAYMKLRIIAAALNEGWEPQFTEDEYRYFPWFHFYTQKEYDKLDNEKKGCCVLRSGYNSHSHFGFVFCSAVSDASFSSASYGSRLAFRTRELASYAGRQFTEEWADFVFRSESKGSGDNQSEKQIKFTTDNF